MKKKFDKLIVSASTLLLSLSMISPVPSFATTLPDSTPSDNPSNAVEINTNNKPVSPEASNTADTEVNNNKEEKTYIVGEGKYLSIQDAIKDIDTEGTVVISKNEMWISEPIVIPRGKKITIKDDNLTIYSDGHFGLRKPINYTGSIVNNKGVFNLKSASIYPGSFWNKAEFMGGIYNYDGSVFNMSGGLILNMTAKSWYVSPVFVRGGATFNMSGGQIKNNSNTWSNSLDDNKISGGDGVLLYSWNESDPIAKFNMTGGEISSNTSMNGGGVYMTANTHFEMTGGLIVHNKSSYDGGGVCVSSVSSVLNPKTAKFVLNGGKIIGNSARNGGGVFVNSEEVYLKKGYIEKNKAVSLESTPYLGHGGGVYVANGECDLLTNKGNGFTCRASYVGVAKIENAVITNNIAKASDEYEGTYGMGGGLWVCPTGALKLHTTNGIALFNNKAIGPNSAGDDFVNVRLSAAVNNGKVTLPNRMLGGGKVDWYTDGTLINGVVGAVDSKAPRYVKAAASEPLNIKNFEDMIAAKAVVSNAAITRSQNEAKLFIRENEAIHGGGIGVNGMLKFTDPEDINWTLKVNKKWDESVPKDKRSEVEVFLKIDNTILDSIKLNEKNEWKGEFTELPAPESLIGKYITVIEGERSKKEDGSEVIKETSQWKISYENNKSDKSNELSITISNAPVLNKPPVVPPLTPPDNPPAKTPPLEKLIKEPSYYYESVLPKTGDVDSSRAVPLVSLIGGVLLIAVSKKVKAA